MKRINLKCKVITPLFMSGGDRNTSELRPSEFKGMMRFWWRAIRCEDDINDLRKKEAEIFGGTGESEGRSKVRIKVYLQPEHNLIGENIENEIRNYTGLKYLLYYTFSLKVKGERQIKKYIKPDFSFTIQLSSISEESFKNALASLWASIYLGGFGTRARRGGGNLVVETADGESGEIEFIPKGNTQGEVWDWLGKNLQRCFKIICNNEAPENFVSEYSNLSFSRIIISKNSCGSWIKALNAVGELFSKFRNDKKSEIFESAVFGLPVFHKNKKVNVVGEINKKEISRRSSPIIIKVLAVNNNFYWMILRLTGEFLGKGGVIKARNKSQKPDFSLLDEFWSKAKSEGEEHILSQPKILNDLVHKITSQISPQRIILFGSRARGDAHKNADIDIAVEDPKKPLSTLGITAPMDVVDLKNADRNLKEKIKREGIIIYERKA